MRTIVHLSDIHFGRVDPAIIEPIIKTISEIEPDVVAVSGDLTQRARSQQFKDARAFLDRLPAPQIVVPGNHDIPLHNVLSRFLQPLDKYRQYITDDLEPFYADGEIAVLGINTARSLTIKGGRINERQVAGIREKLCAVDDAVIKVIVTHHPFDLPENYDENELIGRAQMAMKTLAECGADLFLAGHLHVSHTGGTAERYKISGHSALVVQAGTATSTRGRGEDNSFNIIRTEASSITVERMVWQPVNSIFVRQAAENFQRQGGEWTKNSSSQ